MHLQTFVSKQKCSLPAPFGQTRGQDFVWSQYSCPPIRYCGNIFPARKCTQKAQRGLTERVSWAASLWRPEVRRRPVWCWWWRAAFVARSLSLWKNCPPASFSFHSFFLPPDSSNPLSGRADWQESRLASQQTAIAPKCTSQMQPDGRPQCCRGATLTIIIVRRLPPTRAPPQ